LENNQLSSLPELIGNLTLLEELTLKNNKLTTVPESLGNLTSLEELWLNNNQLTTLPESIVNLKSLKFLNLEKNQLTNLPGSMWKFKSLERLELRDNPWKGEWKGIEEYTISTVFEFCRQRAPIIIYISHFREEENKYRIHNLKEILIEQDEILKIFNRDEQKIPKSQMLLFIATNNSISNEQCLQELKLALSHGLAIIPIKGSDIGWEKLNQINLGPEFNLSHQLGLEFDGEHLEQFCNELYEHIKKYKREVNLFEPEQRKIDELWRNFKFFGEKFVESEDFKDIIRENFEQFKKLYEDLRHENLSLFEYIFRTGQLFKSKSN